MACGDGQTFAASTSGNVWGWGCYKDKEGKTWFDPMPNGEPNIKRKQTTPIQLPTFNEQCAAVEVMCGGVFNIARCSDGRVFSWGLGECGELSRKVPPLKNDNGDYDKAAMIEHSLTPGAMLIQQAALSTGAQGRPIFVEAKNPKSIGCGAYHVLMVIGTTVYACGLNNYGQLGTGNTDSANYLTRVSALDEMEVVSVKGGMHHSLVMTAEGKVMAFGRADSGQLGIPRLMGKSAGEFLTVPEEVKISSEGSEQECTATSISCGSNHNLVVCSSKNNQESEAVYSWGYGDMLALGHGKEQDEFKPRKINMSKASSVDRGCCVGHIVQVRSYTVLCSNVQPSTLTHSLMLMYSFGFGVCPCRYAEEVNTRRSSHRSKEP